MNGRYASLALVNMSVLNLVMKTKKEKKHMNEFSRVERRQKLHLDVDA